MFDQRRCDKIGEGKRDLRYVLIQNAAKKKPHGKTHDGRKKVGDQNGIF